jgi:hypothetical protein
MPARPESRIPRPKTEYFGFLRDQVELLRNAAERYDQGSLAEASNLAVRVRVLVHDGREGSKSMLSHLNVRDRLPYLDTAPAQAPAGVLSMHAGLSLISATLGPGGSSQYAAPLDNLSPERRHPASAFVDWWHDTILEDHRGNAFSRRDFVLSVANQDGGAHVDKTLGAAYSELTRGGLLRFQPVAVGDPHVRNVALPSVRQIAHELERTLAEGLVEDPSAPLGVRVRESICSLSIHESVEVGRNNLCPCGSGRKMKICFGRRQPRRRLSLEDLLAEAG